MFLTTYIRIFLQIGTRMSIWAKLCISGQFHLQYCLFLFLTLAIYPQNNITKYYNFAHQIKNVSVKTIVTYHIWARHKNSMDLKFHMHLLYYKHLNRQWLSGTEQIQTRYYRYWGIGFDFVSIWIKSSIINGQASCDVIQN